MDLVDKNTRWKDLPGNTTYPVNKSILITSTDVRKSNSAAMYLALASYVANGDNIVENDAEVDPLIDRLSPLFLRQGFVASSTEEPFEDYLVQGMGKSPMVMIYESQFIQRAAAADGSITPDMVLMYPDPTIFSKHTFVGLTPDGIRLGDFLTNDPEMRDARHRVRVPDDRHRRVHEVRHRPPAGGPGQPHQRHRPADVRDPRGDDHAGSRPVLRRQAGAGDRPALESARSTRRSTAVPPTHDRAQEPTDDRTVARTARPRPRPAAPPPRGHGARRRDAATATLVLEAPAPVAAVAPAQAAEAPCRSPPPTRPSSTRWSRATSTPCPTLDPHSQAFTDKVQDIAQARRRRHPGVGGGLEPAPRQAARGDAERRPDRDLGGQQVAAQPAPRGRGPRSGAAGRPVQPAASCSGLLPFGAGDRLRDYFDKYRSSQHELDAIITALYHGQDELQRDNASIEQEKVNLWTIDGPAAPVRLPRPAASTTR